MTSAWNRLPQGPAYRRLKERVIECTGLAFYADRDPLLNELIGARMDGLGLRDYSSYTALLNEGETGRLEMDALVAQLTIGETSFFRDEQHFAALRDTVLPDILNRNRRLKQLRIWSAGCATGAEPYSIAIILMREFAEQIAGWQVTIRATDLNRTHLAKAGEGQFRAWALRYTSDELKRECFSNDGLGWTIHPRYKQWISFQYMNLVDGDFSTQFSAEPFDLILCRNVMIYFTPQVNRRLIGQFYRSLQPQGWFMVGGSECNPDNYSAFRTVNAHGARLYQNAAKPPTVPRPIAVVNPTVPGETFDMEGLRRLVDSCDWHRAAAYGRKLLAQNRLDPVIHFYQALISEQLGIFEDSERSLRYAIYLDRNFALAHYHLGLALSRDGQQRAAARSFGNVLAVLSGAATHATLTANLGMTAEDLKRLAQTHLEKSRTA